MALLYQQLIGLSLYLVNRDEGNKQLTPTASLSQAPPITNMKYRYSNWKCKNQNNFQRKLINNEQNKYWGCKIYIKICLNILYEYNLKTYLNNII